MVSHPQFNSKKAQKTEFFLTSLAKTCPEPNEAVTLFNDLFIRKSPTFAAEVLMV